MALQRYVSSELHHFVGRALPNDNARYETLLTILRSGRLRPRHPWGETNTLGRLFPAEMARFFRRPPLAGGASHDATFDRFVTNYIFAYVKPFTIAFADGTPLRDDDHENVYMEREWRILGSVRFAVSDVSRITLPKEYARRFRADCPDYAGQLTFADPH